MKRKLYLLIIVLGAMILASGKALGNDYLELSKHYSVYTSGAGSVRFKIPVWAYGRGHDYYVDSSSASYILLTKNGSGETVESSPVRICSFHSERYGENENKDSQKGTAWMSVEPGQGTAVVLSMYNGTKLTISDTGNEEFAMVKQVEDDDCPYVSVLEFDWFPPEALDEKSFSIQLDIKIYKSLTGNLNYTKCFRFPGPFTGANNLMSPQLSDPYLYTVNASGVTGYGQAAVQYTTFQQPIWYATSLNPETKVSISDRAGTIYVNTTDTVQEQFTATFNVYREESVNTTAQITAPAVDIPPFHRIHDFRITEETDSFGSFTGSNVLQWTIRNPELKDLVDNDYFEIQRATKEDFSDAQTIDVLSMKRGEQSEYTYIDDSYLTKTVTASSSTTDTLRLENRLGASAQGVVLRDANGNAMCEVDLRLYASKLVMPSAPVYYRIRRAASSLWGWNHEFAMADTVLKHNYLAPLAAEQPDYRPDTGFATNHMVHFDIRLENRELVYRPISIDECDLEVSRVRTMGDTVDYIVSYQPVAQKKNWIGWYVDDIMIPADIYVYAVHDGEEVFGPPPGLRLPSNQSSLRLPLGSTVTTTVTPKVVGYTVSNGSVSFRIDDHRTDELQFRINDNQLSLNCSTGKPYSTSILFGNSFTPAEQARINETKDALKQIVLPALKAQNESFGRCIWDRTARLLLCRTTIETGQTIEIIVPQDSIRRQEDGSWLAHMTDVAGEACTHYSYSVRIDQSDASIHVSDDDCLNPVPVNGPDLYFDESATITSFTATQGAAQGYQKNGVNLVWKASSSAVDEYLLTRIVKDSDMVPDTLLRTVDNSFFDESVLPGVHYEYTITALYSCNGKHSAHAASTEGWRTPYGQIGGTVLMTDNSGMAGVTVTLSASDFQLSMTTDASGAFLFDSLAYDLSSGTTYTVTPASQYGVFSYNSTSSGSASVSLSAERAIVSGINFVNTSAVRLSGRVLYKNSTIPVPGAVFVLNGDTLLRNGSPLLSDNDGSFELSVPKSQVLSLQVRKAGHSFEGDGWLRVSDDATTFSLVKALDGVRFYDTTKVRLVGRVAGGNDQKALKHGFELGKNNLGDDLQLVLMIEGDNTARFVHDPDDLSRDTIEQHMPHADLCSANKGATFSVFEQKRIIIHPDAATGEYVIDLFPCKYKVVQATAKGYASLFPTGTGSETFDLTNAPLNIIQDSMVIAGGTAYVEYNAVYDRIYHNPVQVALTQLNYGIEADGMGEEKIAVSYPMTDDQDIPLYTRQSDGTVRYLLGYPVFVYNRRYQFLASAFEEYRYNNDPAGSIDRVPQRGGSVTVRNGMSKSVARQTYPLDSLGRNKGIWLTIDDIDVQSSSLNALRTVTVSLEREGNTIETTAFRAFVEGTVVQPDQLQCIDADITLLDIIRDPGGNGSSAYIESGTTYKFAYTDSYHWKAGLNVDLSWSSGITQDIGLVAALGGTGSYIGATYSSKHELAFTLPIVHELKWGYKYDYTFTTTDRISTSSAKGKVGVGANADVFVGVTTSQLAGKAKAIGLISDSIYQLRQPAIKAGVMHVLAQGTDSTGNPFYLVTGEKVMLGSRINNTFAYSQAYIMQTLIPSYILQRQNLLMDFEGSAQAKEMANLLDEPVYWNRREGEVNMRDTLDGLDYIMILPDNDKVYVDEVKALDNMIWKWTLLLYCNEKEKVMARTSGQHIGTWSVNFGNTFTHSDSYSAMYNYNEMPQSWDLALAETEIAGISIAQDLLQSLMNTSSSFLKGLTSGTIGKSVADALSRYYVDGDPSKGNKPSNELGTKTNSAEFSCNFIPVISFDCDDNRSKELTQKKTSGFTLAADDQGDITVSVFRANMDSVWRNGTRLIRENTEAPELLYGSYVFFTESGSTFCPYEGEERTMLYNEGTLLGQATEYVAKPELSIDTYEQSNIPPDQRATFRIELKNAGQVETGHASSGQVFSLALVGGSNPDGAKLYLNGAPLIQELDFFLTPGETVRQVIEVERGLADDYQDLQLIFGLKDCPKTNTLLNFSVHFLPESSPVNLSFPRDRWVMNTLSPQDSIGYYLPVTIDGFNIRHKNFDHIEFQYKLSTENDDAWVTQCSFYADDSLYHQATGNKAMIENGRITPFRFYGERDPKELDYDLRAVSFCRYGSGFVTKSSPVISGTKDTRPPVLFGKPQPANGILTLEDNISLSFSEPIAGNWLDEDNNFQILGVTNTTGITQSTSLYFDGAAGHYACTKAERELSITDLTLDMLIKPAEQGREMVLLSHGDAEYSFSLSLTADNRLKMTAVDDGEIRETKLSKPMGELSATDFTRVVMVYDFDAQTVRFYAGTLDITDNPNSTWLLQNSSSPLVVGAGLNGTGLYHGNMMELRVWSKPLTHAEIINTHMRRLTGYEFGLLDYYPMNENKGNALTDLATGATLYTQGLSWTQPQGISLATDGSPVRLEPSLFSRTAAEDYTLLFWFRSTNGRRDTVSLFGTSIGDSVTMELSLSGGEIRYRSGAVNVSAPSDLTDGEWHHCVLVTDRTFNNGSVSIDGARVLLFPAIETGALGGTEVWLAKGLKGNIDELCLFEQALPSELEREYGEQSPNGEEMGLINLLTFSQLKRNASNIMEPVFSVNNQRVFRDANGNVVQKEQPLVITNAESQTAADKSNYAPVRDRGQLTRLPFTWNYRLSDLQVNIKAQPREINKRTMYLTVRDVEDMNGNRLGTPVTWTVYADLNSVRWNARTHSETISDKEQESTHRFTMLVTNTTGMTRQFAIEHLPQWLSVSPSQGTLEAKDEKVITFTIDADQLRIGTHNNVVYLSDDQGLSEPLLIEVKKESEPPYTDVDLKKYPLNMSLCGQALLGTKDGNAMYDTDEEDIVYAVYSNECVGMAHCASTGDLYLTVHGDDSMTRKMIRFQLWQASTGRIYNLTPDRTVRFAHGTVYGCGEDKPVQLTASGSEMQNIPLDKGWNWISTNLQVTDGQISASKPWTEGDLIKNPANRQFSTYSEMADVFVGTLGEISFSQMYMVYVAADNTIQLFGEKLPQELMQTVLKGDGQWNPLPCLFDKTTLLRDALADYYDYASPGDLVKSHDRFAVFSTDKRWVGDLTALQPGEGYLMRRMGHGNVTVKFFNSSASLGRRQSAVSRQKSAFSNPKAAANMTMIATIVDDSQSDNQSSIVNRPIVKVYIGDELVGMAAPVTCNPSPVTDGEAVYFLTIQSDKSGVLRFETEDGMTLVPVTDTPSFVISNSSFVYIPDAHVGSLKAPVVLAPSPSGEQWDEMPSKILENDHIVIIRNGERYDVTGKKIDN